MVHESLEVSQTVGLELVQRSLVLSVQQVPEYNKVYCTFYTTMYSTGYSTVYSTG